MSFLPGGVGQWLMPRRALGGGAVVFPPATLFSFSDSPASGNTYIRDRPGWIQPTSDPRYQAANLISSGNFQFADGFNTGGFSGQDLGRVDGGQVSVTVSAVATTEELRVNFVNENTYLRANLASGRNRFQVTKSINGSSTTLYDSGVVTAINVGDVMTLEYSWSGSTCTLKLYVNGARYPNSSTSWTAAASGLLQPSSLVGAMSTGNYTAYASNVLGATPLARLTLNKLHRIYQRDKSTTNGNISVSGIGTGVTAIQFRLLQNDVLVSGWDYGAKSITGLTVDGSGNWSGTISNIPQGTGYQIQLRDSVDNLAGSVSRKFDVGVIIKGQGQSLATQIYQSSSVRTTAGSANAWFPWSMSNTTDIDVNPVTFDPAWDWAGITSGGDTYVADKNFSAFAQPIRAASSSLALAWHSGGYGSRKLTAFMSSDVSVPYTQGPSRTLWQNLVATIAFFGDLEVFIWDQGQEDAGRTYNLNSFSSTDATNYKNNFVSYIAAVRAQVGRTAAQLPVIVMPIGRMYPAGGTIGNYASDAAYDLFFKTQCELTALVSNCYLGAAQHDLTLASTTTSEPHLSSSADMGYIEKACRMGYDITKVLGLSSTDRRGALALSMAHSGLTLAITFDANTATALTCAASIATNFSFWTDNTFATPMTPTLMSIGALSGGQFVVTFTFAGSTAAGNVVSSGKGGAFSIGGSYPDSANALKATQADGRSVVTYPITGSVGYLTAT